MREMVLDDLRRIAEERITDEKIEDIRIGLAYTAVLLSGGRAGVCYTPRNEAGYCCDPVGGSRIGSSAASILEWIVSSHPVERAVGIALLNALVNTDGPGLVFGDMLEIVSPVEKDIVGMVGYFGPFVPVLEKKVKKLYVFEKVKTRAPGLYPEERAYDLLPSCTVAIVTATTLLNDTFERIAEAAKGCRTTVLVGSSAPLLPEVFNRYQIDLVSGIIVKSPEAILDVVSQGGGTRFFGKYVKKVNVYCSTPRTSG